MAASPEGHDVATNADASMPQVELGASNDVQLLEDDAWESDNRQNLTDTPNELGSVHDDHDRPSDINDGTTQPRTKHPSTKKQPRERNKSAGLIGEIRALQQRLEERLHRLDSLGEDGDQEDTDSVGLGCESDIETARATDEEKKLRKHIRRAHFGRRWVEKTEKHLDETEDQRQHQSLGNNGPFLHSITTLGVEDVWNDEYRKGGRMDGPLVAEYTTERERDLWTEVAPHPRRGMRPPTSLRPIYSGKLGPHTQWDTSDSDEWSDDSTHTRDFDYFRARLRGDFEWELDRLNHQRTRYQDHKEKKKLALEAERIQKEWEAKEEQDIRGQEEGEKSNHPGDEAGEPVGGSNQEPEAKKTEKHALSKLNSCEWSMFRLVRNAHPEESFVIDILIGEPKISNEYGYYGGFDKQFRARLSHSFLAKTSKTSTGQLGVSGKPSTTHTTRPDGHSALPERIRIHSKQIIKTLSMIHGSDLVSSDDLRDSVVMLRPFRMLTYYNDEIRDRYEKLKEELDPTKPEADKAAEPKEPPANTDDADDASDSSSVSDKPKVEDPEGYSRSETTLQHLSCLFEFMDRYVSERVAYLKSPRCSKVYFSDLWHFFKPGDLVISADGKQAFRVVKLSSARHVGTQKFSFYNTIEREESSGSKSDITIHCVCIHFDGSRLGPVWHAFPIKKFDGEKSVASLDIHPLRFYALKNLETVTVKSKLSGTDLDNAVEQEVAAIQERLIRRGKLFVEVAAVKHKYYDGLTVDTRDEVESQVMVDFEEAFRHNSEWRPTIQRLVDASQGSKENDSDDEDESCNAICCQGENVHDDSYVEDKQQEDLVKGMMAEMADAQAGQPSAPISMFSQSLRELKEHGSLRDDEFIIMSYSVFGFVLRDRTWAQLDLDRMTDVTDAGGGDIDADDDDSDEEDKTAFGRLVLPKGHKNMVLSLISQHFRNKASQASQDTTGQKARNEQVDIVRGKGKGLIILLHGAPGVGKTTTAEGVAEKFKKPLFQITCGDLGSDAKSVEDALQKHLSLANRWDCILLLDEADVFLAERRRDDFNRNGLVAVFLRVLEYYAGILFLTTNRIGDFDEAFASRIHMSLHYPPLDEVSTTKVFKLNLGMIRARFKASGKKISIQETEILTMAGQYWRENEKARWNGRQIRNACQTALALAEFDAQPKDSQYDLNYRSETKVQLTLEKIKTVSDAYCEFIKYLSQVHGADAGTHAHETGRRARESAGNTGGGTSSSQHVDEDRKQPLRAFRLGGRSRPEAGVGQPDASHTQAYEAPGAHIHHAPLNPGLRPGSSGRPGVDPRTGIPFPAYHHAPVDPNHQNYASHLRSGAMPGVPGLHQQSQTEHQAYPPASTTAAPVHPPAGQAYSTAWDDRDMHAGGGPLPGQGDWRNTAGGVDQGSQPGLGSGMGHSSYDQRRGAGPPGGYTYPSADGGSQQGGSFQ